MKTDARSIIQEGEETDPTLSVTLRHPRTSATKVRRLTTGVRDVAEKLEKKARRPKSGWEEATKKLETGKVAVTQEGKKELSKKLESQRVTKKLEAERVATTREGKKGLTKKLETKKLAEEQNGEPVINAGMAQFTPF